MNDPFDYRQYGTTELSEEQRQRIQMWADEYHLNTHPTPPKGAAVEKVKLFADYNGECRDTLCTALRELDRLRAENAAKDALWQLCVAFVKDRGIGCSESIWQTEKATEEVEPFIESICEIVGYDGE